MKTEAQIKQEHILEAAIKRFSHFGIHKTTLTDIADDLAISKPALFYYFHDKNSLVHAVAEKIINEFLSGYEQGIINAATPHEALLSLIEVKRRYFKKYFLLAIQGDGAEISRISPEIPGMYEQGRQKAAAMIAAVLEKGISQKVFRPMNTEQTSLLLLETLSAFEQCIRTRKSVPDMKDIDELFDKQKEVLTMIINGLIID